MEIWIPDTDNCVVQKGEEKGQVFFKVTHKESGFSLRVTTVSDAVRVAQLLDMEYVIQKVVNGR